MNKGFGTLFIVIILGSASLALTLWISTSSFWSMRSSIDNTTGKQVKALTDACAEVALETIRENNSYIGSGNVIINNNTCTYTVTNTGGSNRSISISGSIGTIMRKLQITTTSLNPITINSWTDIP
jgi:hypothetical protein